MGNFQKLSIIIPCYNEEQTVHLILDKVLKVQLRNNIIKELIDTMATSVRSFLNLLNPFPEKCMERTNPIKISGNPSVLNLTRTINPDKNPANIQ